MKLSSIGLCAIAAAVVPKLIVAGRTDANKVSGTGSYIGGGESNGAHSNGNVAGPGDYATVGGGEENTASGEDVTVGGGKKNTASGYSATVGGGRQNEAFGDYGTVGGGLSNVASGYKATVGGGMRNMASGPYSTISGGENNIATMKGTFVAGKNGRATHTDSAVLAFNGDQEMYGQEMCLSQGANTVAICAPNGLFLNGVKLEALTEKEDVDDMGEAIVYLEEKSKDQDVRFHDQDTRILDQDARILALESLVTNLVALNGSGGTEPSSSEDKCGTVAKPSKKVCKKAEDGCMFIRAFYFDKTTKKFKKKGMCVMENIL